MGTILIIADPQDRCYATPRGLELARRLGHKAEIVAFTYANLKSLKLGASEQTSAKKKLLADREAQVEARVAKYAKGDQKVSVKAVWSKDINPWVIKRCQRGVDMVVKTGHRSETLTYTPTDWQLLRECPAPVLIVAERKWHKTKPILAALDLNTKLKDKRALNREVLRTAAAMSAALDAELRIINALEVPVLLADLDLVNPDEYAEKQKQEILPTITKLAAEFDLPEGAFRCKRGPVPKVITSTAARDRAQLVVMGTVGRRGVKAKLLGNTAENVLQHLRTDVLALKP